MNTINAVKNMIAIAPMNRTSIPPIEADPSVFNVAMSRSSRSSLAVVGAQYYP
jgi:hypothetical protein